MSCAACWLFLLSLGLFACVDSWLSPRTLSPTRAFAFTPTLRATHTFIPPSLTCTHAQRTLSPSSSLSLPTLTHSHAQTSAHSPADLRESVQLFLRLVESLSVSVSLTTSFSSSYCAPINRNDVDNGIGTEREGDEQVEVETETETETGGEGEAGVRHVRLSWKATLRVLENLRVALRLFSLATRDTLSNSKVVQRMLRVLANSLSHSISLLAAAEPSPRETLSVEIALQMLHTMHAFSPLSNIMEVSARMQLLRDLQMQIRSARECQQWLRIYKVLKPGLSTLSLIDATAIASKLHADLSISYEHLHEDAKRDLHNVLWDVWTQLWSLCSADSTPPNWLFTIVHPIVWKFVSENRIHQSLRYAMSSWFSVIMNSNIEFHHAAPISQACFMLTLGQKDLFLKQSRSFAEKLPVWMPIVDVNVEQSIPVAIKAYPPIRNILLAPMYEREILQGIPRLQIAGLDDKAFRQWYCMTATRTTIHYLELLTSDHKGTMGIVEVQTLLGCLSKSIQSSGTGRDVCRAIDLAHTYWLSMLTPNEKPKAQPSQCPDTVSLFNKLKRQLTYQNTAMNSFNLAHLEFLITTAYDLGISYNQIVTDRNSKVYFQRDRFMELISVMLADISADKQNLLVDKLVKIGAPMSRLVIINSK